MNRAAQHKLADREAISNLKQVVMNFQTGGCLFTQSHADHVIGLQDERSLHIDEGQSVLDTGTCVLKAGGVCAPPQVRKLYK